MNQHTSLPPLPPLFFGDNALYDFIMKDVEPELVSDVVPTLGGKYASESQSDRKERAARYERAFAEYDKRFEEYKTYWKRQMQAHQRAAMQSVELASRENESSSMTDLESSILSA